MYLDIQTQKQRRSASSGFTVLEFLVVVAIVGVLTGMALPSFAQFLNREKLGAIADEFAKTVTLAGSAAIKSGVPVILCPSSNGDDCSGDWASGWMAFVDGDRDGIPHPDENVVARRDNPDSVQVTVNTVSGDSIDAVRFNFRGATNLPLIVNVSKGSSSTTLEVSPFGQPRRHD